MTDKNNCHFRVVPDSNEDIDPKDTAHENSDPSVTEDLASMIFGTTNTVIRTYRFDIVQSDDENPIMSKISIEIYKYLKGDCMMADGSRRTFTESDDPQERFFMLKVDTLKTFSEAIAYFKEIGLSEYAEIAILSFDKGTVRNARHDFLEKIERAAEGEQDLEYECKAETNGSGERKYFPDKFVIKDLDSAYMADIDRSETSFMRILGSIGDIEDPVDLGYQKDKDKPPLIVLMYDKITPTFRDILAVSPLTLSENEITHLEQTTTTLLNL